MSNGLLFMRYAWVCAENKLRAGKISQEDFGNLKWLVENKMKPAPELLERCFPKAFRESLNFPTVAEYWHQHQGSGGDCATKVAFVVSANKITLSVLMDCEGTRLYKPNIYKLDLEKGDRVYLHKLIPIEKVEQGAIVR